MTSISLLKYTSLGTKNFVFALLVFLFSSLQITLADSSASIREIIKNVALQNGLKESSEVNLNFEPALSEIGSELFSSKHLSNTNDISCRDCHSDDFSSADGVPLGLGVGSSGHGLERIKQRGEVIPRNTLPLWGRGQKGFDTFFWDGRVSKKNGQIYSQFGAEVPSDDPLQISVHLPLVEIKEMVIEQGAVKENKTESLSGAIKVYSEIMDRLFVHEQKTIIALADFYEVSPREVQFSHVAEAISEFIRDKFRLKNNKFQKFVFEDGELSSKELSGAQLFYGKAKCSVCHSGVYYSDFNHYSVAFPQLGAGKNGFGVDYGRYNATHDVDDLYKFRTPPLLNVTKTAPYGHSGSVQSLKEAITYHYDPLKLVDVSEMSRHERVEYYKKLLTSSENLMLVPQLKDIEVENLIAFLKTLEF